MDTVIGMLSDEIETLRESGQADTEIAKTLSTSTGADISASDIAEHYATPDRRRRGRGNYRALVS